MATKQNSNDKQYSIRVASRMTGISSHTLRMWERRYGFPVPQRTPGGARRYTADDVARLKLISKALEAGYRPNEVVGESPAALQEMVAVLSRAPGTAPAAVIREDAADRASGPSLDRAVALVEGDDLEGIRDEIRAAVAVLGPKRFLVDFAHPLLIRVGDRWRDGALSVRQEHLFSELLTTQIRALIAGYEVARGRPTVLLTTLPDELHSLGLQMVALYLALVGAGVRLLGPNAPTSDIVSAAVALDVDVVGISVSVASSAPPTRAHLATLLRDLPRKLELWVGGEGSVDLMPEEPGVKFIHSFEGIDRAVADWRTRHRG
ncbi:MAG: MerR family transcriptional regulator [Myxococcota bacterium]